MKISFRPDGLSIEGSGVLEAADAVLRGIGQVMLQNNSYTGVLFLAGAFVASPVAGLALLVGAIASTLTAMGLGADREQVRTGLFGFNGALVAIALAAFFRLDAVLWPSLLFGAACSTVATAAFMKVLGPSSLPALTAPFVLVTWGFIAARTHMLGLHASAALPSAQSGLTVTTVAEGLVRGVAQVFLQTNLAAGGLFLVGLLVASRLACAAAISGSLVGLLAAWAFGAPEVALRNGLYGYNAALTAIALSTFLVPWRGTALYVAGAVVASAVASAALSAVLAPLEVPALTAPFVVVVWGFLLAAPSFVRLTRDSARERVQPERRG